MKKLYFLSAMLMSAFTFGQNVVITTVVDGSLPGDGCSGTGGTSSPKVVELYVTGTVDFTNYRFQTESNGAADASAISWNAGLDMTPIGTVTDSFVYLAYYQSPQTSPVTFQEMYPAIVLPTGLTAGNIPNGNGNDAYRVAIYDAPTAGNLISVIDQFGNPLDITDSSDNDAPWSYLDSYAKRVNGVGPNGGNFDPLSFTHGGNDLFDAPNNTCAFIANAIQLGSFQLGVSQNDINGLQVFPNPVTNGNLFITTALNETKSVAIYDVLGKKVINTTVNDQPVNVSALNSGVYIVKVTEAGKTATRKLVIK